MPLLPNSGLVQPALGFGAAYLKGGLGAAASARLVHAAIAEGIRHFDVAPIYGSGTAEQALGLALVGRRAEITIASKVGIARPSVNRLKLAARAVLSPLASHLRSAKKPSTSAEIVTCFDPAFVAASVAQTLANLKTDYLDILLLHEAGPDDLSSALIDYLLQGRADGRFRAIGVGSSRHQVQAIASDFPGLFDVYQYNWNALVEQPALIAHPNFHITHRSVMGGLPALRARLQTDPVFRQAMRDSGFDPGASENLPKLLLGAAVYANPSGLTLMASRREERIVENAKVMHNPAYVAAGGRFLELLKSKKIGGHDL